MVEECGEVLLLAFFEVDRFARRDSVTALAWGGGGNLAVTNFCNLYLNNYMYLDKCR
jgi:hypothetical protein